MRLNEKTGLYSCIAVVGNLRKIKTGNYKKELMSSFRPLGCDMSIKVYSATSYTVFLRANETPVKNKVNDFTKILNLWRTATK